MMFISLMMIISLAKQFSQMESYEIDSNYEAVAGGISNLLGSFFHGLPASASLGRSSIQYSVGGRSQCASIVACTVLLVLLTTIGKYVAVMPKALLASIILVNMMLVVFRTVFKVVP